MKAKQTEPLHRALYRVHEKMSTLKIHFNLQQNIFSELKTLVKSLETKMMGKYSV